MAKKTNPTPAKTAKKKPVTTAERVTLERVFEATTRIHVQHTKALNEIKRMVENCEVRIMQRMDSRIDATTGRLLKDVLDMRNAIITETNAIDETVDRIERLLATPQDVTGSPVDIPEQGLEPGDYTDAYKEVADALTAMNLPTLSERSLTGFSKVVWSGSQLQGDECLPGAENRTHHPQAEFISRASVTAKALGLVAKDEEPWRPEVGDWAVVTERSCFFDAGHIDKVLRIDENGDVYLPHRQYPYGACVTKHRVGKPTPEEVAKYHADQEAAKPIVPYVTRVMYGDEEYLAASSKPNTRGRYRLVPKNEGLIVCVMAERGQFTVIDP